MLRFILIRSKSQKCCVYAYAAKTKCVPYALTTYYALQLQRMNGSHAPHHLHKLSPKTRKYIKGSTVIKIKGNSVESAWFSMEISLKTQKGAAWKCDTREKQSFPYCCFPCKSKQNMPAFSLGFPPIQAYPVYPCQQGLLTTLATFLLLSRLRLPRLFAQAFVRPPHSMSNRSNLQLATLCCIWPTIFAATIGKVYSSVKIV